MIKLIATDMDGTLLNAGHEITTMNQELVEHFMRHKHLLLKQT